MVSNYVCTTINSGIRSLVPGRVRLQSHQVDNESSSLTSQAEGLMVYVAMGASGYRTISYERRETV